MCGRRKKGLLKSVIMDVAVLIGNFSYSQHDSIENKMLIIESRF